MKKLFFILPVAILIASSCGPSKSEVEAQARLKAVQDSISTAAEMQRQDELKQQLIDLKARLEAEQAKLGDTEQFHLLRSEDEKAQQIEAQTKIVEELKSKIEDIQKQIK